jgi:hypothetical protein
MSALGQTSPAEARASKTETIRDLESREVIARNVGMTFWNTWPWAMTAIADRYECDAYDVHTLETDKGDLIAVNGKPIAYFEGDYDPESANG